MSVQLRTLILTGAHPIEINSVLSIELRELFLAQEFDRDVHEAISIGWPLRGRADAGGGGGNGHRSERDGTEAEGEECEA